MYQTALLLITKVKDFFTVTNKDSFNVSKRKRDNKLMKIILLM